jgi:Mce-associated membrane protein
VTDEEKTIVGDAADDELVTDLDEKSDEKTDEPKTRKRTAPTTRRRIDWLRVVAYGLLPGLALLLALTAGYLKYLDNSVRDTGIARTESMQTARDTTIAMLSYQPDTVEAQLNSARDLLTGGFKESYTSFINGSVIPGAKQQHISAVATVPRVASVSAEPDHAVVLAFVNQTVVVGANAPTETASSVRVTLDKHGDKWLISDFQPVQ